MRPPAFALSGVPRNLKASAELAAAQGDDGVGALYGPMPARPLEPGADHHFTACLHHAGRGAEVLFVNLGISHAPSILQDVVDTVSRLSVWASVHAALRPGITCGPHR